MTAQERFERGLTDLLNVIDAQRQAYDLEQQYVVAQENAAAQFVALYRSLGGGWELYQSIPPIPPPMPAIFAAFKRLLAPMQDRSGMTVALGKNHRPAGRCGSAQLVTIVELSARRISAAPRQSTNGQNQWRSRLCFE